MADRYPICAVGMATAVGDSAAQTASSVQAGISRYQDSPVINRRFEPMVLALIPDDVLPPLHDDLIDEPFTSRQARLLRIGGLALAEVTPSLGDPANTPVLIAAPEPIDDRPPPVTDATLGQLRIQSDVAFDLARSAVFPGGRASGMEALDAALKLLDQGAADSVLVGGIDTYLDLMLLATLDAEGRVLADGVMDGFAPGEGAGFLLIARPGSQLAGQLPTIAEICPPALAQEPGHRYSDEVYRGEGLAEAATAALETLDGDQVRTVISGMNGENLGAKEWGVTSMRNAAAFAENHLFEHPADCFGDTGAAAAPLLIALASMGMAEGYLPSPSLILCSSDGPLRGAVTLAAAGT